MAKHPKIDTVIELNDVRFSWPGNSTPTLDIPTLSVKQGQHVFIKGPSGCGKSTLLNLFTGITTCESGSLKVLNTELASLSQTQRDRFRADNIGYIFQQFNLLPYLSVIDNVILPCHFSGKRKHAVDGDLKEQARQILQRLHLAEDLLDKHVVDLSIGQQQRVAAARALIGKPRLVIADEPTSALDFANRSAFIELLMEQAEQAQSTLVFVSHDPTLEALFNTRLNLQDINLVKSGAVS
ncbi:methionine ABC transporter ATP-binding protein [Vibrio sp. UCD-FRSSP16_10]|uniref:ABC transporter ATP-binding protein n=1 Tax=unclassified Vibrio TaxID=2614977 RepID=UPI0007FF3C16|nr:MULTISPECIES: ABC transporter ATP-binding protein [unclassified Vibrio]OBT16741.1 methionine ABC transporter ATP-binding protein [Vibrio sp. UCD-FRSSP16_30]OBT21368.1 methionine ABC transporter ATP-binding protein [Vibrio sp. UCD-FRSSP16_10]